MVFGTFRIYGYSLCFAVRGFRKRCSMARFRDGFAACFRVLFPSSLIEGSCASSLLFLSVVSVFPRLGMCSCGPKEFFLDSKGNVQDFFDRVLAVFGSYPDEVWDFSLLRLPLVFCCSRFSGLCFAVRGFRKRCSKARFREAQKIVFVDSKGNVREFFGSGFGRFRLVSRWCLGLFASRAPRPERVLLFEAFGSDVDSKGNVKEFFGSGFGRFRLVSRWCLGLFASRAPRPERVLLFEAFGKGVLWPDFATVLQRVLLFEAFGLVFCCSRLWIPKVTCKSFLARVLAVFGSCPDGV